jgi:mono/diheme cytochrome c family protein
MKRAALVLVLTIAAWGCAGDGSGLADDMMGPGGIQPTLASLQAELFTPRCTDCHVPGGPGPMPLDSEDVTFQNLVGVPSVEMPQLMRVAPGDPENSYIVHKVEGRPTILFDRMPPPPQAALDAEQIAALRQWITDGAPR